MSIKKKGMIITAVVASLFATASFADSSTSSDTKIKCMGVNNCKSMGACKAGSNNCGSKNACRSLNPKSIVNNFTAKECEDHGGTIVK
jgi:uncharacterized membrane protein